MLAASIYRPIWIAPLLTVLPFYLTSTTLLSSIGVMAVKREIYVPTSKEMEDMTPDARMWYLTGVSNANKNLAAFSSIAAGLEKGENVKPFVKTELESLLPQVIAARDNTKTSLVPKLTFLVESFVSWTRDPSWLDKIKLKASMAYIKGKRDNKSYYLQNGGGLWYKLRLDDYLKKIQHKSTMSNQLVEDFERLEDNILLARDSLETAAQQYVQGMAQLEPLVGDIGANKDEIRAIVDRMKAGLDSSREPIIRTADDTVTALNAEIAKMKDNGQ